MNVDSVELCSRRCLRGDGRGNGNGRKLNITIIRYYMLYFEADLYLSDMEGQGRQFGKKGLRRKGVMDEWI